MKTFFAVFRAGFLYLWSDPVPVAMLTLFPIVIIFVLGNALASVISNDDAIQAIECAYVSDTGSTGLYEFLTGEDVAKYISLTVCAPDEAEERLMNREAACIIRESGGRTEIVCLEGLAGGATVALSMVEAYREIEAAAGIAAYSGRNPTELVNAAVEVEAGLLGGRLPKAIDYFAVTMLVMILLYTGMNGMALFQKNLTGVFGQRLQASPARRGSAVAGTVAVSTAVSFMQAIIVFVFSWAVYGVYWGHRVPLVLLTLFILTLFSQLMCIFTLLLVRNVNAVTGILQVFFWISTFVSKGFATFEFGEAAEKVFGYAPNALAHTVIFGAIYGGEEAVMAQSLIVLASITVAFGAGAYFLGRRRLA